jgi:hypothetical protein
MKEFVLNIKQQSNPDEKEELISSLCFDAMFAVQQGAELLVLKSQGSAIPICADLVLEIERRLKSQLVPIKKRIFLNSKFFREKKSKYDKYPKRKSNSYVRKPKMISFMDVKFFFKH